MNEDTIYNKRRKLCVSGGVFMNTVLNSKILDVCSNLYVDPFADDSGLSMGAAQWHANKFKFNCKKIKNLYLGDPPNYQILIKEKLFLDTSGTTRPTKTELHDMGGGCYFSDSMFIALNHNSQETIKNNKPIQLQLW